MRLFDTHSHLDDEQFDNDREEIIKKIWENDVKTVMEVGSSLETSLKAVNIANSHDFIYASVGIHPEFAENADDEDFQKIKTIAETEPKVKAIGEIGIDYYYDDSAPRESQLNCFQNQILIAKELDLPIIVHDRQSKGDTLKVLKVIPIERLMIETDSPYMAPEPFRGRRNDSRYVKYVAEKMAEVKGIELEQLCEITYQNGLKFFNITKEENIQ